MFISTLSLFIADWITAEVHVCICLCTSLAQTVKPMSYHMQKVKGFGACTDTLTHGLHLFHSAVISLFRPSRLFEVKFFSYDQLL